MPFSCSIIGDVHLRYCQNLVSILGEFSHVLVEVMACYGDFLTLNTTDCSSKENTSALLKMFVSCRGKVRVKRWFLHSHAKLEIEIRKMSSKGKRESNL